MLNGIINYRFICAVAIIFFLLEVKYKFPASCHVYACFSMFLRTKHFITALRYAQSIRLQINVVLS